MPKGGAVAAVGFRRRHDAAGGGGRTRPLGLPGAPAAMDVLQSLVQKSFVQQVADDRFDMLVSCRNTPPSTVYAGRHAGSGLQYAQRTSCGMALITAALQTPRRSRRPPGQPDRRRRRAVARGDNGLAVQLLETASAGLMLQGPYQAEADLATEVLALASLSARDRARAHWVVGHALHNIGREVQARVHMEAACSLSRESGHRPGEARALRILALVHMNAGDAERARSLFDAAMAAARELSDAGLESDVHNGLGNLAEDLGRIDEAHAHYQAALAPARAIGDRQRECSPWGNLAVLYGHQGRTQDWLATTKPRSTRRGAAATGGWKAIRPRPRRRRRARRPAHRLRPCLASRLWHHARRTRPAGLLADGPLGRRPR